MNFKIQLFRKLFTLNYFPQLKDDVCSPAGTAIQAIRTMEKAGFRGIIMDAVHAASKRALELSRLENGEEKDHYVKRWDSRNTNHSVYVAHKTICLFITSLIPNLLQFKVRKAWLYLYVYLDSKNSTGIDNKATEINLISSTWYIFRRKKLPAYNLKCQHEWSRMIGRSFGLNCMMSYNGYTLGALLLTCQHYMV